MRNQTVSFLWSDWEAAELQPTGQMSTAGLGSARLGSSSTQCRYFLNTRRWAIQKSTPETKCKLLHLYTAEQLFVCGWKHCSSCCEVKSVRWSDLRPSSCLSSQQAGFCAFDWASRSNENRRWDLWQQIAASGDESSTTVRRRPFPITARRSYPTYAPRAESHPTRQRRYIPQRRNISRRLNRG
jgi:hypothetical protein